MMFVLFGFMTFTFWQSDYDVVKCKEVTELTIELLGDETIYLIPNSEYVEYGAKAYDPIQGDISDQIVIDSSSINNAVESTYRVSYTITNELQESKVIYRHVVVDDFIDGEYSFVYGKYTGKHNKWNKIIETSDGNLLAVGTSNKENSYSDSRTRTIVAKIDRDMNVLWKKTYSYREGNGNVNDKSYDCIEADGKYIITSYESYYGYTTLIVYDFDGTKIKSLDLSGC